MISCNRKGFNLIECLICIGIIALLIGLVLPSVRRIREPAQRMTCSNNLKPIMLGLHNYADCHPDGSDRTSGYDEKQTSRAAFPAGCYGAYSPVPESRLSWQVCLLPFVEQDRLFGQFDPAKGFVPDSAGATCVVKLYLCPSARKIPEKPLTNYIAMAGLGEDVLTSPLGAKGNGFMGYDRASSFKDISDGLANTMAIAETNSALDHWAKGGQSTLRAINPSEPNLMGSDRLLGSLHSKGLNVAMCDGSVRFLSSKTSSQVLADMITIAGGEQIDPN